MLKPAPSDIIDRVQTKISTQPPNLSIPPILVHVNGVADFSASLTQ